MVAETQDPSAAGVRARPCSSGGRAGGRQQDLRSPDARDAERTASPAQAEPIMPRSTTVIESTGSGDQTVPTALAGAAIGIALAGLAVALVAVFRRPRSRWTVS